MKRKNLVITALLASALALTACGGGGSAASGAASGESAAESTASTSSAVSSAEAGAESGAESGTESGAEAAPVDIELTTALNVTDASADQGMAAFVDLADYKGLQLLAPEGAAIENGMTVNIDFKGEIDGVPFEGGTAENYDLTIGSGKFIPGYEEALIGWHAGETAEFDLAFPENYGNDKLNGKTAHWTVPIHEVYIQTADQALESVTNASTIKEVPQDLYDEVSEYVKNRYDMIASVYYGMELSEMLTSYGIDLSKECDAAVRTIMVHRAIAEAEGYTYGTEAYTTRQAEYLSAQGFESLDAALENGYMQIELDIYTDSDIALEAIKANAA